MLRKRLYALGWIVVFIVALWLLPPAQAVWACGGTVICVDVEATGAATGLSWTDAFTNVQDALAVTRAYSTTDYEIWIAAGTYTPDVGGGTTNDDPAASFRIAYNNVKLYGGFAGTETARDQRDWGAHPTILSGDLQQDDIVDARGVVTTTAGITGTNAYHVLYLDGVTNEPITGTTVIDGVIITAGQANDSSAGPNSWGGGLYCDGAGGGHACSPSLANVTFSGNWAFWSGGGMFNYGRAGTSTPNLTNVTFSGNWSRNGGGMSNNGYSGNSSPTLINVTFSDNHAEYDGGGMSNQGAKSGISSPSLTNVTFSGNHAGMDGGGMYNDGSFDAISSPMLTNVILWGNTAGNSGNQMHNIEATPTLSYTLIQSGANDIVGGSVIYGPGILAVDPGDLAPNQRLLGPLGDYGGATLTLPLLPGNPAIDTGEAAACPTADQRGITRPQGAGCDMGAFESQGFALSLEAGDEQHTPWGMDFANPFQITVSGTASEPVDGGVVAFRPPSSGPSVTLPRYPDGVVPITAGSVAITGTANTLVGSYVVTATTSGVSAPVLVSLTNDPRSTEITASVSPTQTLYTDYVQFHATVTDTAASRPAASGWVTFTVADGGGTPVAAHGSAVGSDGTAYAGTSELAVGTYSVTAIFEGATYQSSTSQAIALTVNPLPTSVALTQSATASVYGDISTFVARVTIASQTSRHAKAPGPIIPTGVVTFTEGQSVLATVMLDATGQASFSTNTLPGGDHPIIAYYGGDAGCVPSASDRLPHTIIPRDTETALYAVPAQTHYGQPATFVAAVRGAATPGRLDTSGLPATPTGDVIFKAGADALGTAALDASGLVTFAIATLPAGDHAITAHYQGDGNYAAGVSDVHTHTVALSTSTIGVILGAQGGDSYLGERVTLTVTVAGGLRPAAAARAATGDPVALPTGDVRLQEGALQEGLLLEGGSQGGGTVIAVATLVDGSAVFTLDDLPLGRHTFTAVYEGDANYAARTSAPFVHTVWTRVYIPLYVGALFWPIWP